MAQGPDDERLTRFPMFREVDPALLAEAAGRRAGAGCSRARR